MPDPVNTLSSPTVSPAANASVAVVIAAWRASASIGRAIASALAQPEAAEIIVVDDASGDAGATLAAARAADDGSGRLVILAQETNSGPARARNTALAASRSPWVCVLDSDDFIEPGRLAALLAIAGAGYDFIADDLLQTLENGDLADRRPLWFRPDLHPDPQAVDLSLAAFVRANLPDPARPRGELGFLKPLMRREFLDRHGLRYDETMRLGEDYDLYARALAAGARFRLIPAAGYVAVIRAGSLSGRHGRPELAAFDASDVRLLATPGLSAEETAAIQAHRLTTAKKLAWIDFILALKRANLPRAVSIMLREPRCAAYVLGKFSSLVLQKLGLARPD